mmetsp:Transcript_10680/g.27755  ORF Transcript_10680/g.27755 Transcript_10680/m.27755 type:complete len:200 (-) Transcript_10680:520-1119(-)
MWVCRPRALFRRYAADASALRRAHSSVLREVHVASGFGMLLRSALTDQARLAHKAAETEFSGVGKLTLAVGLRLELLGETDHMFVRGCKLGRRELLRRTRKGQHDDSIVVDPIIEERDQFVVLTLAIPQASLGDDVERNDLLLQVLAEDAELNLASPMIRTRDPFDILFDRHTEHALVVLRRVLKHAPLHHLAERLWCH